MAPIAFSRVLQCGHAVTYSRAGICGARVLFKAMQGFRLDELEHWHRCERVSEDNPNGQVDPDEAMALRRAGLGVKPKPSPSSPGT
ncbi:hypothetical protein J7E62_27645 [Variovorax paradoxus]|nr:hypothetical protein [Variovorax paradoxus]